MTGNLYNNDDETFWNSKLGISNHSAAALDHPDDIINLRMDRINPAGLLFN